MPNWSLGELAWAMDSVTIYMLMALKLFISSPEVSRAPALHPTAHSATQLVCPAGCQRPTRPSSSFYLGTEHPLGR